MMPIRPKNHVIGWIAMAPTSTGNGSSVGERMLARRKLRGWSVRFAADRAGIAHSTWSRIERGERSADNRFVVAKIAQALEMPVSQLTGQPLGPHDLDGARAEAMSYAIVQALVETDLDEEPTVATFRPIVALRAETELLNVLLHDRCDYIGMGQRIPGLLRELHAASKTRDRAEALALTVRTSYLALCSLRSAGLSSGAWLAAERSQEAADMLESPTLSAIAGYCRSYAAFACGSYLRGGRLALRAADNLVPHLSTPGAHETYGQLLLSRAYSKLAVGDNDEVLDLVGDATRIAQITGETAFAGTGGELLVPLYFGPTNVDFWRISMYTDGGEPGLAVRIANSINPGAIQSKNWRGFFYQDLGRALARIGQPERALRMLLAAERVAPSRTHSSAMVQETVRSLAERATAASRNELRAFCERMGILN